MKRLLAFWVLLWIVLIGLPQNAAQAANEPANKPTANKPTTDKPLRTTVDFNDGWSFALVEKGAERSKPVANFESPDCPKLGDALIPEKLGEPKAVRLPHDWAISGPFDTDPKIWGGQGKLPWRGVGWYTKTFKCPQFTWGEQDGQKHICTDGKTYVLDFGGCMAFPEVYVNGKYVGGWDYGYLGFQINITPYLIPGDNTIAVRCDTRRHGSRWYPGAGIYRPVRLVTTEGKGLVWLKPGDVTITTPKVSAESAEIVVNVKTRPADIKTDIQDRQSYSFPMSATVEIKDPQGNVIGQKKESLNETDGTDFRFTVKTPARWDVDAPIQYSAAVRVAAQGGSLPLHSHDGGSAHEFVKDLDEISVPFGIRQIEWTADDGFHLNGRRVQLYGVDLHHDQGVLGAAAHPTAIERQLKIMRDMGVNAIRTSHNPASPEFMDACDRLGFIVWDELFDKWDATSDLLDQQYFDPFVQRQVRQLVNRDKNRPSVCVWSIGNEIWDIEQNVKGGSNPNLDAERRVKLVADAFRKFDPSRLVGMGCFVEGSCGPDSHVRDSLDVSGWNYGAKYLEARVRYPNMPLLYTESASAVSTRGYYELVDAKHTYPGWFHPLRKDDYNKETLQVDGYDLISASGPRDIPDIDFDRMERDRYVAGEFVWTGFDYIGEPTPFDKLAKSSYFGIVDLVGLPKDRFFLYRSYWNKDALTVHILPHWNWQDGDVGVTGDSQTVNSQSDNSTAASGGQKIVPVYVYTNGDSAELFLNGKSLGKRSKRTDRELPQPIQNLAAGSGVAVTASSEEGADEVGKAKGKTNFAPLAFDGKSETRWCAADDSEGQSLTVDFAPNGSKDPKDQSVASEAGKRVAVRYLSIEFERPVENYQFRIQTSDDGQNWRTVCTHDKFEGSGNAWTQTFSDNFCAVRCFRIVFDKLKDGAWASIREFALSATVPQPREKPAYYDVIDKYRLRWENVAYEPGTLEAVAYKTIDGKPTEIGRETVRTAGAPAKLRLTPEPNPFTGNVEFRSDDDIAYVLVESVDKNGTVCPLDNRIVTVKVDGPAELVGIANGDPMGMDAFTDATHPLFYGKAIIAVRSRPDSSSESGSVPVKITAASAGLETPETDTVIEKR